MLAKYSGPPAIHVPRTAAVPAMPTAANVFDTAALAMERPMK
ncbi:hypothetical protein ACFFX0_10155 [Citricoccus parietis]|uniref:Uncharacterized protein n=1 Tax=Citricoccus parietis TaxID=592307 RepID=A0ABV5FY04_9MICC